MEHAFRPAKRLHGELSLPGDKSISHRAALFGALAEGTTRVKNFLFAADCLNTVECLRHLGVEFEADAEAKTLTVHGKGMRGLREPEVVLDAGNSATAMRSLLGLLAGQPFFSVLTGDASLRRRPMRRVVEPLRAMGANIAGRRGGELAPLAVMGGELQGIDYELPVASAQVRLSLLLAGLCAKGTTRIYGGSLARDHSERLLRWLGADLVFEPDAVSITPQTLQGADIDIPGDLSSAAFLLAAAAILPGSELLLRGVGLNPTRAGFLSVLNSMGAMIMESNLDEVSNEPRGDLTVSGADLLGTEVEPHRIPAMIDEVPLIAVVGTQAKGKTRVTGAEELRVKETDRISAICSQLSRLGAFIEEEEGGFTVSGPTRLQGAALDSFGDHRIAMALAVAALCAEGETTIAGWECVDISFPGFEKALEGLARG